MFSTHLVTATVVGSQRPLDSNRASNLPLDSRWCRWQDVSSEVSLLCKLCWCVLGLARLLVWPTPSHPARVEYLVRHQESEREQHNQEVMAREVGCDDRRSRVRKRIKYEKEMYEYMARCKYAHTNARKYAHAH
jgi:hypothetical protein